MDHKDTECVGVVHAQHCRRRCVRPRITNDLTVTGDGHGHGQPMHADTAHNERLTMAGDYDTRINTARCGYVCVWRTHNTADDVAGGHGQQLRTATRITTVVR